MIRRLLHNKPLVITTSVLFLLICSLVIAWQSALYTLNHMNLKHITTTQMAAAMRNDEFWSSNRFNTLVFSSKVKMVSVSGNKTTLDFVTSDSYGASCELTNPNTTFKVGEAYTFAVETYQAERLPHGVLLHNCLEVNP